MNKLIIPAAIGILLILGNFVYSNITQTQLDVKTPEEIASTVNTREPILSENQKSLDFDFNVDTIDRNPDENKTDFVLTSKALRVTIPIDTWRDCLSEHNQEGSLCVQLVENIRDKQVRDAEQAEEARVKSFSPPKIQPLPSFTEVKDCVAQDGMDWIENKCETKPVKLEVLPPIIILDINA